MSIHRDGASGRTGTAARRSREAGLAQDGWAAYFLARHTDFSSGAARRLDYSNERVRFQTYAAVLEAAGPPTGKRCLDSGCGFGDLSRMLAAAGAKVDAFDVVKRTIRRRERTDPHIRWFVADVAHLDEAGLAPSYDLVFATELLQYTEVSRAIRALFGRVAPGGRLVGCVPHAKCPVVEEVEDWFEGRYSGISVRELVRTLSSLRGISRFAWRGAVFDADQFIVPYRFTPWREAPVLNREDGVPNRLHFVATRA